MNLRLNREILELDLRWKHMPLVFIQFLENNKISMPLPDISNVPNLIALNKSKRVLKKEHFIIFTSTPEKAEFEMREQR